MFSAVLAGFIMIARRRRWVCFPFGAIVTGVLRIILALRLRKEIEGEWWMALSGLAGIVFGGLMVARPGAGALAVLWVVAIWAIVGGVCLVLFSFKVKALGGKLDEVKQRLAGKT